MTIEKLTRDLAVISKLSDYPGSQDGLSTNEFKAKFDEAPLVIQEYINEVLLPGIDDALLGYDPEHLQDTYLKLTGGKMTGALNMNGNRIRKLAEPIDDGDATPRSYVLPKTGGQMTGSINMGGNRVTGLGLPTADGDAATKGYVEGYIGGMRLSGTVILAASAWVGSGPFTQEVALDGVTEEDCPHYGVVYSGTNDEKISQREAFSRIDDMETGSGVLSFTCFDSKPSVDITVQVQCLRNSSAIGDQAMAVLTMEEGDGYPVQALIDGTNYNVRNAVLNGTPTENTYDFTVL